MASFFFQATSSASGILKEGCVERCATRHDVPKILGLSLWVLNNAGKTTILYNLHLGQAFGMANSWNCSRY